MHCTIDLPTEELQTVRRILHENVPGREVWAFGSRVTGKAKPASDLDLCIRGASLSPLERADLLSAFEESNLPIKVDIAEWSAISRRFREIIRTQYLVVQDGAA